jgi:hypothetical protein
VLRVRGVILGGGLVAGIYTAVVRGDLTLDLGVGRRVRVLGPQEVRMAAPQDVVFDVIAGPYMRTPRAMRSKLEVLERGADMVLAAHHTPVAYGLTATTVETVRFDRPGRIEFRLVRGPVPHVVETFDLREEGGHTVLLYTGEMGTDLWALGEWWGSLVARSWERTVAASLAATAEEAERRARSR